MRFPPNVCKNYVIGLLFLFIPFARRKAMVSHTKFSQTTGAQLTKPLQPSKSAGGYGKTERPAGGKGRLGKMARSSLLTWRERPAPQTSQLRKARTRAGTLPRVESYRVTKSSVPASSPTRPGDLW